MISNFSRAATAPAKTCQVVNCVRDLCAALRSLVPRTTWRIVNIFCTLRLWQLWLGTWARAGFPKSHAFAHAGLGQVWTDVCLVHACRVRSHECRIVGARGPCAGPRAPRLWRPCVALKAASVALLVHTRRVCANAILCSHRTTCELCAMTLCSIAPPGILEPRLGTDAGDVLGGPDE